MPLDLVHCFLVHPGKTLDKAPRIGGTRLVRKQAAKLFDMLADVYEKADRECNIEIAFVHAKNGQQQNDCRDRIVRHVFKPEIASARALATELQAVTTQRSGLRLLFCMSGEEDREKKLVLSRFPADSGILAEEKRDSLSVELLERVFMRRATAYKSALYRGESKQADFWKGAVVDKQIDDGAGGASSYWIHEFLLSDFFTTSAQGTRYLADALRAATAATTDVATKTALTASAVLARGLDGQRTSIRAFAERMALPEEARDALLNQVKSDRVRDETFVLSTEDFDKFAPYRSVELDTGAMLTARTERFDDVFRREDVRKGGLVRYLAEGRVVNDTIRRGR